MQQQQAHPASAAAAACRRTCLPSPRLGKSARRDWRCRPSSSQGGGRPASLDGDTASMAKAYGGFFRGKRARAILNYRGDEHSESGTRVRCTVEQQKRMLDCAVSFSGRLLSWDLAAAALLEAGRAVHLLPPSPAPLVMGNKRAFPVAFTLTAISRAPSAPRTAQPGRSVSISDNGGCRRRRSAPRHVTGLSHRSRGIQSAIYPRYLGEQQAGAGKCHRRGCAEGRRGVVCPRA